RRNKRPALHRNRRTAGPRRRADRGWACDSLGRRNSLGRHSPSHRRRRARHWASLWLQCRGMTPSRSTTREKRARSGHVSFEEKMQHRKKRLPSDSWLVSYGTLRAEIGRRADRINRAKSSLLPPADHKRGRRQKQFRLRRTLRVGKGLRRRAALVQDPFIAPRCPAPRDSKALHRPRSLLRMRRAESADSPYSHGHTRASPMRPGRRPCSEGGGTRNRHQRRQETKDGQEEAG